MIGTTSPAASAGATDSANTAELLAALDAARPADVLVLSDSTGNDQDEWPRLLALRLAARYPGHRVLYSKWDSERWNVPGTAYRPEEALQDGPDSAPVLHLWNGAVPGWFSRSPLGPQFDALVVAPGPEHVIISFGHNEGTAGRADDEARWRGQMLALTTTLAAAVPGAPVTLTLQNPRYREPTLQSRRAVVYREIATLCGYGIIDVAPVFLANPRWREEWMKDDVHPNAAGEEVWADEAARAVLAGGRVTAQPPPSGPVVLRYDTDTEWTCDAPVGWAPLGDVRVSRVDGRMLLTGPAGARVRAPLPATADGQTVTVVAWVCLEPGAAAGAGAIALGDSTTEVLSRTDVTGTWVGAWHRLILTASVGTGGWVELYAGQNTTGGPAEARFERVLAGIGALPPRSSAGDLR
jgi:lysophospholipase L1-like esterase